MTCATMPGRVPEYFSQEIDESEKISIIRSILVAYAKYGASYLEVLRGFKEQLGVSIKYVDLHHYLANMEGVWSNLDKNGIKRWHIMSDKSKHLIEMIKQQKCDQKTTFPPSPKKYYCPPCTTSAPYFKDNIHYNTNYQKNDRQTFVHRQKKYFRTNYNQHYNQNNFYHTRHKGEAFLHDYRLLGDDFLLSFAITELGAHTVPNQRIKQAGLCISGQTIKTAINRIRRMRTIDPNIIINIGSVDILHGHELMDIISDFRDLIEVFELRGITPIITTLAPLVNCQHRPVIKNKLNKLNDYIRDNYMYVIDLNKIFLDRSEVLFECYQQEPRYVSGSNQPHVLWSKIGRQRVLQFLKRGVVSMETY